MTEHVQISQGRVAVIEFENFFDPKIINEKYKKAKDKDIIQGVYSPVHVAVLCAKYPEHAQYFVMSDLKTIEDKVKEVQIEYPEMEYGEFKRLYSESLAKKVPETLKPVK